jgi:hypothetical protein
MYSKVTKAFALLYCFSFAISINGENVQFPLHPRLSSKLDTRSYSMGETFVFSSGAASIWLNPARMGDKRCISLGGEYENRSEGQVIWREDILNFPQLVGISCPLQDITFGLLYFIPYNMSMKSEREYKTILRNLSMGCGYRTSSGLSIGGALGILWGNSDEKLITRYIKDVKDYKVKGLQGSFGLTWRYNLQIDIGLVIRTPAFLKGECKWNYSGPNLWNEYGDTTFSKVYSISERYFYPINISSGMSFNPSQSLTFNTQLSYIGWHVKDKEWRYDFGEDELDINLGTEWNITRYFFVRIGAYIFYFPLPSDRDISLVPSLTGGLGIKIPYGTIDIAFGSGEEILSYSLEERTFILLDFSINF